jgi:MoxR-like ATPase
MSPCDYWLLLIAIPATIPLIYPAIRGRWFEDIEHMVTEVVYAVTTNRILQVLEEEKPEIVLLDELDKLPRNFAEKLLGFLESGRVKVDQKNCQMDFELKGCKVFATANEINRLSKPLQSRFRKLFLPRYTEEQFLDVSEKVLSKTSPSIARYIAANVWKNGGDIRDVISIGKLVRSPYQS